jgi:hypothetical protein
MTAVAKVSDELASNVERKLGAAATAIYEVLNVCSDPEQLDEIGRLLWKGYGEGSVDEGEASFLSTCILRRRPLSRLTAPGHTKSLGRLAGRIFSRFTSRRPQRSPDREASRNRRRMLGGSSALPANLRHHYTEGERAALCIVAGEVKHHGICDLPIGKIAALAGVSRTTVQNAFREARLLGHITIEERPLHGRKSLTNVLRIVSSEWRTWIARGPSLARCIGFKMIDPTKNTDLRKRGRKEGAAEYRWGKPRLHTLSCIRSA